MVDRRTMPIIIMTFIAMALLIFQIGTVPADAAPSSVPTVRRYQTTTIYNNASAPSPLPAWAVYDDRARIRGSKSLLSYYDDAKVYDPIDFCVPFFQMKCAQMYISPNGFLALSPYERNNAFMYASNPPLGGYGFCADQPTAGDYPIVGLFVTDLDPGSVGRESAAGIYKWVGRKALYGDGNATDGSNSSQEDTHEVALVEWYRVPGYNGLSGDLVAQVELWGNGTIIMRYDTVLFAEVVHGYTDVLTAGSGLIWTKRQRYVSPDVRGKGYTNRPAIIAIRYDPMPDPCAVNKGCDTCAIAEGCAWCDLTSECVGTDVVDDVCPMPSRNTCTNPDLNTTAEIPQRFYAPRIARNVPFMSIENTSADVRVYAASQLPVRVSLGMRFPFFSFPLAGTDEAAKRQEVTSVFIGSDFTLNITRVAQPCVRVGLRSYITTSAEYFWSVGGQCRDGDYLYSVVPYGTSLRDARALLSLRLPARPVGSQLCTAADVPSGATECPAAFVYEMKEGRVYAHDRRVNVTFQVVLSADGSVRIHYASLFCEEAYYRTYGPTARRCNRTMAWGQYYAPHAGVLRRGVADPSSVTIPWTVMEKGLQFTAVPIQGCLDCSGRGYCDPSVGRCVCKDGYSGSQCEQCLPGRYGPTCALCPSCAHGGQCLDGVNGSGFCKCVPPYSGADCSVQCASNVTQCPGGCGVGYCTCGVCACPPGTGYYGDRCQRWVDPCRRHSLLGCAACVTASNYTTAMCEWCSSTSLCLASSTQWYPMPTNLSRATCMARVPWDKASTCLTPVVRAQTFGSFATITIIVVLSCVALCACLVLTAICMCRKKPFNPLRLGAVPGVPNFNFPRRDREIIGISRLPIQGRYGRSVQGIPLKQIPMQELVMYQRMRRREKEGSGGHHCMNGGEAAAARNPEGHEFMGVGELVDWDEAL